MRQRGQLVQQLQSWPLATFFDAPAWSACSTAAELAISNTVAPRLSLVPLASRRWPRDCGG
eukprot:3881115-Pleurochrysis_carterae.AAC.1